VELEKVTKENLKIQIKAEEEKKEAEDKLSSL